MNDQPQPDPSPDPRHVNTEGGDYIAGNADKRQDTFIGRDQHNYYGTARRPEPTAEQAQAELAALPLNSIPAPAALPPGSRMALLPNQQFVGRADEFKALAVTLKRGTTTVIAAATGMGGIGKTQLATEFAHRYGQFFLGGIFWLSFAEASGVQAEIAACGHSMNLPGFAALPFDEQIRRVQAEWRRDMPRLLVFDNCEDEQLLREHCPAGSGCRVLVTSRRQQWSRDLGVAEQRIDTLPRAESIALLRTFRANLAADDTDLDAIAAELGDLPLALHVAGSFLKRYQHAETPAAYLARLRGDPLQAFALRAAGPLPTGHERDVARTFMISYEQLQPDDSTDILARQLLARAACFAPGEPIPRALLLTTLALNKDDTDVALETEDALLRLNDLGLLESTAEGALRLHRLLVHFAAGVAKDMDAQPAVEQAMLDNADRLNEAVDPQQQMTLQIHLRHIANTALPRASEIAARLCNTLGYHLHRNHNYIEAHHYYNHALIIFQHVLPTNQADTAATLNNLGTLFHDLDDLAEARLYLEQALIIRQLVLGDNHPDTAKSFSNLGLLLRDYGDIDEARQHSERALAIQACVLGLEHPDTATSLNNLVTLLLIQGDYASARLHIEQLIAFYENVMGPQHPMISGSLNNLASLCRLEGNFSEAATLMRRVLRIREAMFGPQHPHTQAARASLAIFEARLAEGGAEE